MTDDMQDKEFVEYVLKTVVDNPNDVNVERTIDEMGVLLSVTVNPDDMGKVIGKSGQTAKAIRTLLKVVGAKHDARVNMKIIEPEGSEGRRDNNAAPATAAPQSATDADAQDQAAAPADPTQAAAAHTAAVDDAPLDETSVSEAAQDQHQTDASIQQPDPNDSYTDEANAHTQPQDPVSANEKPTEDTPANSETQREQAVFEEKSPLDEL